MSDDKTPATPEEAKAALEAAYELGRAAGLAEEQPQFRTFSNGVQLSPSSDPGYEAYDVELRAKRFELLERGEFRPNHPEFAEIKARHGR